MINKRYTPNDFLNDMSEIDNLEMLENQLDDLNQEELEHLSRVAKNKQLKKPFSGSQNTLNAVRSSSLTYTLGLRNSGLSINESDDNYQKANNLIHSYPIWFGQRAFARFGTNGTGTNGNGRPLYPFLKSVFKGIGSTYLKIDGFHCELLENGVDYELTPTFSVIGKDNTLPFLYENLETVTINTIRFITNNSTQLTNALRQASLNVVTVSKMGSIEVNSISLATFIGTTQFQQDIIDIPLNLTLGQNNLLMLDIAGDIQKGLSSEIVASIFLK